MRTEAMALSISFKTTMFSIRTVLNRPQSWFCVLALFEVGHTLEVHLFLSYNLKLQIFYLIRVSSFEKEELSLNIN